MTGPGRPVGTTSVRLGSFNLLSGRSLTDGLIETARLVEAVAALDADVLALQEVDRFQPRSGRIDQTAVVARTLGAVHSRFVATVTGTPGELGWTPAGPEPERTLSPDPTSHPDPGPGSELDPDPAVDADQARFGIALISRRPVAEWHVLRLPPARGRFPVLIPSRPPRLLWLNDEPRAVVAAVLAEPRITIACTHLSFVPLVNLHQLRVVRDWLARLPGPKILLGDLNLTAGLARRGTGWTPLVSAPTFPSPAPRLQMDHALAVGLPAGSRAQGRVVQLPISDHRALRIDLDLPR